MRQACPNPWCREGLVSCTVATPGRRVVRHRRCPTCHGIGVVEEDDEDLRSAGVVVWGRTEEDFRSSPTHWRARR